MAQFSEKEMINKLTTKIDNFLEVMAEENKKIRSDINNGIIFFTNNIIESFHSQLNKKFIGFCKTMFNYKNALIDVIELYEMKNKYIDKKISLTRALVHYVKSKDTFDLITHKEISHIKSSYKEFLISNQLSFR